MKLLMQSVLQQSAVHPRTNAANLSLATEMQIKEKEKTLEWKQKCM